MNEKALVEATVSYVKKSLEKAEGGHDWSHVFRVWRLAKTISIHEEVDHLVVELGALLHDIADHKFHHGDEEIGPRKTRFFLETLGLPEEKIQHVENIVRHVSYKGGNTPKRFQSHELEVIQDADRLDAMGAIGIARTFNYGGFKGRALYDPTIPPLENMSPDEYKKNQGPTLNHFYEKLLKLKNGMHTETARKLAEQRHQYMETFLEEFLMEWNGER